MTRRLIEAWLPIAALGEESVRERRSMTALPPTYYLHVWWARRPLVASRAAILASLLPADADHDEFLHVLGIHGDPVTAKARIAAADRRGERLGADAYGYPRAFTYVPTVDDKANFRDSIKALGISDAKVLDPTAGGGSIPFESVRLGLEIYGNDLNPVATVIERATLEWPLKFSLELGDQFVRLGCEFSKRARERLAFAFPEEDAANLRPDGYLWARTITCPHCDGLIPLAPNWRLAPDGSGVRLSPSKANGPRSPGRTVGFLVVNSLKEHSPGTVSGGDATCCFDDCGRLIHGDEVKRQAQAGQMGEQLYTVVYKRRIVNGYTKSGKPKEKWIRGFRAPRADDDVSKRVQEALTDRYSEWDALDIVPNEHIGEPSNYDRGHRMYGMYRWTDMFSPRQLLVHATSVEIFRELLDEAGGESGLAEFDAAAFVYLAIAIDKLINYNARTTRWDSTIGRVRSVFDSHNFAMVWSYAELVPLITGVGYDWALDQTAACITELVQLIRPKDETTANPQSGLDFSGATNASVPPRVTLTCKSGDSLDHIADGYIDCVVMDPPYYDNVMYAELSDFFYVWLKRTAGYVYVCKLTAEQLRVKFCRHDCSERFVSCMLINAPAMRLAG